MVATAIGIGWADGAPKFALRDDQRLIERLLQMIEAILRRTSGRMRNSLRRRTITM